MRVILYGVGLINNQHHYSNFKENELTMTTENINQMRNTTLEDDLDTISEGVSEAEHEIVGDEFSEEQYESFEEEYGSYESYEHMSKQRGLKKMKW